MSDTRYPTRMHEVLGVEVDEEFEIIDYPGVTFLVPGNGWMCAKWPSGKKIAGRDYWASAINHGIVRRPRLTEEQVKQLKALHKALKGQVVDIEQTLRDAGVEVDDG